MKAYEKLCFSILHESDMFVGEVLIQSLQARRANAENKKSITENRVAHTLTEELHFEPKQLQTNSVPLSPIGKHSLSDLPGGTPSPFAFPHPLVTL